MPPPAGIVPRGKSDRNGRPATPPAGTRCGQEIGGDEHVLYRPARHVLEVAPEDIGEPGADLVEGRAEVGSAPARAPP